MTRRLILIRHAKSSWDNFYADDHARVLNDRGVKSAEAIGKWLAAQDCIPDVIATSDATRTLQTTTLLKRGMGTVPITHEVSALYHAAPQTMIDVARAFPQNTVALVGHNPGIAMMAEMLVKAPPDNPRFEDYPTCATTLMDFEDDTWCQPGKGQVINFVIPREL
ncbi:MAG: histidine phosphatase family protein [Pseudomonadota bacterium]